MLNYPQISPTRKQTGSFLLAYLSEPAHHWASWAPALAHFSRPAPLTRLLPTYKKGPACFLQAMLWALWPLQSTAGLFQLHWAPGGKEGQSPSRQLWWRCPGAGGCLMAPLALTEWRQTQSMELKFGIPPAPFKFPHSFRTGSTTARQGSLWARD